MLMMGKISVIVKIGIQTLLELGLGYKAITKKCPINPLDYHVWGWMMDKFNDLNPQPKNVPEQRQCF